MEPKTPTQSAPAALPCGGQELRCVCRNLLARRCGDLLEFKCRRCKRVLRMKLASDWKVLALD
jgi:hypothetical protein